MAVIDTVEITTKRTRLIPVWHEKRIVATVFGGLGLIGLTVLAVAVLLVSQDSTRPSGGHPVVSVAPTPKPAPTVPPPPTIASPPPVASPPSPTEAPPADAPPVVVEAPSAETAAPVPAAQLPPNWQRLRRWLWAHQHPRGQ